MFSFLFRKNAVKVLGKVATTDKDYEFTGTSNNDSLTVLGSFSASGSGVNRVSTGDGNDAVTIIGKVESQSRNEFDLGNGNNTFTSGGMIAKQGGVNTLSSGSGKDVVTILGNMEALANSSNILATGDGNDVLTVTGKIRSEEGGRN